MAAVRMYFKKGTEGWDFGYLTMQLWLKTFLTWAFQENKETALAFWKEHDLDELIKQFQAGEALFTIEQTLLFLKVIDQISKYLVSGVDGMPEALFKIIRVKTSRFKDVKEFEKFYLQWSTETLTDIGAEFDKEPQLKGALNKIIK